MKPLPDKPQYKNVPFRVLITHPPGLIEEDKRKKKKEKLGRRLAEEAKKMRPGFEKKLVSNISQIRNFMVQELASFTLPTVSALDDTRDVINEATGIDIDPMQAEMLHAMQLAAKVRLWHWIPNYFNFNAKERQMFLALVGAPPEKREKDRTNTDFTQSLENAVNSANRSVLRELRAFRTMQRRTEESPIRLSKVRSGSLTRLPPSRGRP